ncbi:exodeoxyribonuclease VII large subunit [Brochothrix thermosphacta]|uniref:Exodeoxyribonuclease 7 large subunit n=2 Tax=Listeriaceae TaxID=186820 RepID=A0A291KHF5_BROTH|nr:exodeoxyribonuclease VII large subunit [Brochothrix thermosphacta]ATH85963.1 exodeoxyribonuclease VII large subunit [Brochothrix thermosphacta]MPQ29800.1 exodeoxyribonuclease VII large subunit [Brochothrix thermosphacta]HCZ39023.1 exodeoxyribonuclease VII large subunit [Brochothrix thermosphacta]HCZ47366.1 exodeoxyribonuclease VII large subunit [Brochothrix thermosphacta]
MRCPRMSANYLSVTLLTGYIARKFSSDPYLKKVYVQGEISNFKRQASGHLYLTIKDEKAQIRAVMFAKAAQKINFQPEDGMKVLIQGRVDVFERGGNYQFYVEDMQPDGVGALFVRFEQLKKSLTEQGVFNVSHKLVLPTYPKRIGVITSPTGAAVRDIITTLKRRSPQTEIVLFPAAVQGDKAIDEISHQIKRAGVFSPEIDVLIVGRGGGSIEDLWAFNEEKVVRAIYESRIPIISAVGHETDTTLSDYAADYRAPTPTAAAEIAVRQTVDILTNVLTTQQQLAQSMKHIIAMKNQRLLVHRNALAAHQPQRIIEQNYQRIDNYKQRLSNLLEGKVSQQKFALERVNWRLLQASPADRIQRYHEKWENQSQQLTKNYRKQIDDKRLALAHVVEKIEAVSPMQVMKRGFSLIETQQHKMVKSVEEVAINETLQIRLSDGIIKATVTDKEMASNE